MDAEGPLSPRELVAPLLATRNGFPRVDWQHAVAAFGVDGAIPNDMRERLVRGWLEHLVEAHGPAARHTPGEHFHLVELPADERARHALRWAKDARTFLLRHLDGIAAPHGAAMPLLLFERAADYIDYHADFEAYTIDQELASSGGMFLDGICPHVAAPYGTELELTLVHELAHAHVRHLPLPPWLNEGLAVAMECLWRGQRPGVTSDDIADHRRRWNRDTLQWFWTGAAFRDTELQRLAYQLAHVSVTRLAGNYDLLRRFANAADAADAGAGAFAATYGRPLASLLEPILGRGAWQPDLSAW